jgi:hypothetical protein
MRYKQSRSFSASAALAMILLCSGLLTGCLPSPGGGSERGERKKMFTLDEGDISWEGNGLTGSASRNFSVQPGTVPFPPLPFVVSDTLFRSAAGQQSYILLRLPTADYDFLLLGAKTYESYFPGWLKAWPQTGREGLMIDLSAGKAAERSVFQLTCPGLERPVPLVLLWDAASEGRAGFYTQLLQSLTAVQCENALERGKSLITPF